jgi:translation initiation factor IF-2
LQPRYNENMLRGKRATDAEAQHPGIFRPEEEAEPVDQLESSDFQTQRTSSFRGSRTARDTFKARGSLLSRLGTDAAIPSQSKMSVLRSRAEAVAATRKKRFFAEKKIAVDVFIPSTLSVGTLARLLNVRLGMRTSQHFVFCVQIVSITDRTTSTKNETVGHGE